MRVNLRRLIGKIAENDFTKKAFAEAIGMTEPTLRRKLRGESEFTLGESAKIKEVLNLTTAEYLEIMLGGNLN